MTTSGTHTPKRPAQRERAKPGVECRKKKAMLLDVVMKGGASHIRDQLLREYRAQTEFSRMVQQMFYQLKAQHIALRKF